nr:neuroglobin-like isoform X1 [Pelodiscus sinensis]|eukprot:XP_025044647.1 neuroglobin-like isoform X1 [Pelodiscus sinensis]
MPAVSQALSACRAASLQIAIASVCVSRCKLCPRVAPLHLLSQGREEGIHSPQMQAPHLLHLSLPSWFGRSRTALLEVGLSPLASREMGCALSGSGSAPGKRSSEAEQKDRAAWKAGPVRGGEGLEAGPFPPAGAQKERIQESWRILHDSIARVGIIVFIRLFETHPECKDAFFLFRDIEDLQQLKMSKELQAHGLRVMSFIEKSVARLDQEDKLEHLAFELGRNHYRYSAPPKYYEYVGVQFISAVQPILKERWTPELQEAWQVGSGSAETSPSPGPLWFFIRP